MVNGSCLCGAVSFTITAALPPPVACHCGICRKHTGHFEASTDIPKSGIKITGEQSITWYHSSEKVRRGFCHTCGSSLFFDPLFHDWIGVSMGVINAPTGVRLAKHIFVADKGDYYDITDDLPQEIAPPG